MALRATPTIAICLTAGIAAGVALARPGDEPVPTAAEPVAAEPVAAPEEPAGDSDSPYLVDADAPDVPTAVAIEDFAFSPVGAVAPGTSIDVTNLDGAPHTLTATDGSFDTGTLGQNESAPFIAPTAPGTYEFFCAIHPSMTGEFVVS